MGRTSHEISCVREGRNQPVGRAIASSGKRTLDQLGIPRATFYRWYDRYREGDLDWNRIPDDVRGQIINKTTTINQGRRTSLTYVILNLYADEPSSPEGFEFRGLAREDLAALEEGRDA